MSAEAEAARLRSRIASLEEAVQGYEEVVRQQSSQLDALARDHYRRAQDVAGLVAQVEELAGQLAAARDEAEAASVAKARFLANMSHELRTPMNGVIGMIDLILEGDLDASQREYAEIVRDSARHLLRLLNDILDFSKIEAGRLLLDSGPVRLRRLVEDALDAVAVAAAAKGLDLAGAVEDGVPEVVTADGGRLRQILLNLLGNAVKFTEAGEVSLTVDGRPVAGDHFEIHVAVTDTGIGIGPRELAGLFSPFIQADATTTRRFGGTGLGLAIARSLAEAMGGRAWAESAPGSGSSFHVTAVVGAGPSLPDAEDLPAAVEGMKVLVLDRHGATRRAVTTQLRRLGVCAVAVGSLEEAGSTLATAPFDAILVDEATASQEAAAALTVTSPPERPVAILVMSLPGRSRASPGPSPIGRLTKPVRRSRLVEALAGVRAPLPAAGGDPVRPDAGMGRRHPLRILVAEDNVVNQKVLERMLGALGYAADVVSDGAKAISAAESGDYDVVFMDIQMPVVDGLEATSELRRRTGAGGPRVVALTAAAFAETRRQCLEAGMDDFLAKPVRIEDLAAALERCAPRRPAATT